MFDIGNKYSLELHWEKAVFNIDGICELVNAYFTGPVLSLAAKINSNDMIRIDFYSQYVYLVRTPYVAVLKWADVIYKDDRVYLDKCFIEHVTELNKLPFLLYDDWLLIDTSTHTIEQHPFNLVYPTYVMNPLKDVYNFRK
jgi:hypothetical protein